MSKEEFVKIRTCVLKVHIHCDGCQRQVKKLLQKIEGVYQLKIDSQQGKVTVLGNVDPNTLIKKLVKSGKHAELWGDQKGFNNNNNNNQNQLKNMQMNNGKVGGGGGGQQQIQQNLQQMKGFKDLNNLPQLKDLKLPFKQQDQKSMKFNLPEDDDFSDDDEFDDEYDDDDDDDDFDEDDYSDEEDDFGHAHNQPPVNKLKPMVGNNGNGGGSTDEMLSGMMKGLSMGDKNKGTGGGDVKRSVAVPVQVKNLNGNGDKKDGGGEKNGGGKPQDGKNGGGGVNMMNNVMHQGGFNNIDALRAAGLNGGGGGGGNVGHMNMMQMRQMGQIPAVQGLPAAAMNPAGGGGMNPYHQNQQQGAYMAPAMMQGNNGYGEGFHPMMYTRQPPMVSYYPAPVADPNNTYFSDENTDSCNIM